MAAPWILGDAIMRQGFAHSWPSHIGSTGPPILAGRILPGKLTFVTDSSAALKETPFLKFASPTCLFRDPDPSKTAMQFRWTSTRLPAARSLVSKGLNGIKVRRPPGGENAEDQPHRHRDARGQ